MDRYMQGFMEKCASYGVTVEQLAKVAQDVMPPGNNVQPPVEGQPATAQPPSDWSLQGGAPAYTKLPGASKSPAPLPAKKPALINGRPAEEVLAEMKTRHYQRRMKETQGLSPARYTEANIAMQADKAKKTQAAAAKVKPRYKNTPALTKKVEAVKQTVTSSQPGTYDGKGNYKPAPPPEETDGKAQGQTQSNTRNPALIKDPMKFNRDSAKLTMDRMNSTGLKPPASKAQPGMTTANVNRAQIKRSQAQGLDDVALGIANSPAIRPMASQYITEQSKKLLALLKQLGVLKEPPTY